MAHNLTQLNFFVCAKSCQLLCGFRILYSKFYLYRCMVAPRRIVLLITFWRPRH